MKKMVKVEEVEDEGLMALIGERVLIFCARYIYEGELVGVNTDCILLKDAGIVYETGPLVPGGKYKDRQALPRQWYVARGAIESFG